MLWNLLSNTLIFCLGFFLVSFVRFAVHTIRERVALRNIPGPVRSSFLWGEEWTLYKDTPGLPYATWHKEFGKVVKFTGAFGVSRVTSAVLILSIDARLNSIRSCP